MAVGTMCDRSWQGTRQQPGAGSRTPSEAAGADIILVCIGARGEYSVIFE